MTNIDKIRLAFGNQTAKLAEEGYEPNPEELAYRLEMIEKHGVKKGRAIAIARRRYQSRKKAERFREATRIK